MDDVIFTELKIQDYLVSEELSLAQKQNIFLFRTRMSDFHENFRVETSPYRAKCAAYMLIVRTILSIVLKSGSMSKCQANMKTFSHRKFLLKLQ